MASAPEQLQEAKKRKRAVTADDLKECCGSDEAVKRNRAEQRNVQTIRPPHTTVNVDLKAESGATAFSPVFSGSVFHSSMTINWNPTTGVIGQQNPAEGQTSEKQVQHSELDDVEDQPIQSDWKRPHSITRSSQEFKDRILLQNNVYIPKDKSQRKCLALLITNIQFKHLKYRAGAERDEDNMKWLLEALGYRVKKYRDLTGEVRIELVDF
ncbi:hypothetical protein PO909_016274 [Leuciscus waleckii]